MLGALEGAGQGLGLCLGSPVLGDVLMCPCTGRNSMGWAPCFPGRAGGAEGCRGVQGHPSPSCSSWAGGDAELNQLMRSSLKPRCDC